MQRCVCAVAAIEKLLTPKDADPPRHWRCRLPRLSSDRPADGGRDEVICLDNYFTGRKANIARWIGHPRFELIRHDVTEPIKLEVDLIWHLACPASPIHYQFNPVKTAKTSFLALTTCWDWPVGWERDCFSPAPARSMAILRQFLSRSITGALST